MHSKVVIIGSGPAAHTAAVYLGRAELKPVMYEGMLANDIAAGGQLTTTTDVENYPGFPNGIMGGQLMEDMRQQSLRCGTEIITETVAKVDLSSRPFKYWCEYEEEEEPKTADALIIATGAAARRMGLPGEDKYWNNGVSACAVCDGAAPIFKDKDLVVIGGGDSAAEEAIFLTKYGTKVHVLIRRDQLRASKAMETRLRSYEKTEETAKKGQTGKAEKTETEENKKKKDDEKERVVKLWFDTVATEVLGDAKTGLMSHLNVKNVKTGEEQTIIANGLFYAIGHDPATKLFKGQIEMDEDGYILTKPGTSYTNIEGVFAAGDVQDKRYRQAITSAGSGCIAALEAERWLAEQEEGVEVKPDDTEAKKPEENSAAPEYRQNPLL